MARVIDRKVFVPSLVRAGLNEALEALIVPSYVVFCYLVAARERRKQNLSEEVHVGYFLLMLVKPSQAGCVSEDLKC